MGEVRNNRLFYDECPRRRKSPQSGYTEELEKTVVASARVLPTFETSMFDALQIKHYSMTSNDMLRCRWQQYKKHAEHLATEPFFFPDNRDLHFYNGGLRFIPGMSIHKIKDHRMKLRSGPGVDYRGQVPIPNELLMKRGVVQKEERKSKKNATKSEASGKVVQE